MAHIHKLVLLMAVGGVVLGGCGRSRTNDEIALMGSEKAKAEYLAQIERKYENPEAHYQLGKLYHQDGLWDKAEFEYNVALGFDPVHYRSQAGMVKTLLASGQEERAKLAAEMYMNQAAAKASASVLLGQAFQRELMDEYALACYRQALGLSPNSAAIHKQIGYYYLSKKDMVLAEEYLRRSFQLDPYQPEVAGELGKMGVVVQIPRKVDKSGKKADKAMDSGG